MTNLIHAARWSPPGPLSNTCNWAVKWYHRTMDRVLSPQLRYIAEKIAFVVEQSMGMIGLLAILQMILSVLQVPSDTARTVIAFSLMGVGHKMLYLWNTYAWDFLSRMHPQERGEGVARPALSNLVRGAVQAGQSPILVGPAGSGKTSLISQISDQIPDREVYRLEYAKMNGADDEMFFVRFCDMVTRMILNKDRYIVFIDEVQQLSDKFRNALKLAMDAGVPVIAATTDDEFRTLSNRDDAFCRRFRRVDIPAPTVEESCAVVMRKHPNMDRGVVRQLVEGLRLPEYRALPAVALKLLDSARADQEEVTARNVDALIQKYRRDLMRPEPAADLNSIQREVQGVRTALLR